MSAILRDTLIPTLMGFAGAITSVAFSRLSRHHLNLLVYLAAGVLFAVTVCDVLPDAKEILSWPAFWGATASGYALFWLIGRYLYPICPACTLTVSPEETPRRLDQTAVLVLITLGLHSTLDGIAIAVGDRLVSSPSHTTDLAIILGVSIHKLPEGLALALLLLGAGYTRRHALLWSLTIEATTLLGGLLGALISGGGPPFWIGLLFGHIGGGFLYLVTSALQVSAGARRHSLARPLITVSGLSFLVTALLLWAIDHYAR